MLYDPLAGTCKSTAFLDPAEAKAKDKTQTDSDCKEEGDTEGGISSRQDQTEKEDEKVLEILLRY